MPASVVSYSLLVFAVIGIQFILRSRFKASSKHWPLLASLGLIAWALKFSLIWYLLLTWIIQLFAQKLCSSQGKKIFSLCLGLLIGSLLTLKFFQAQEWSFPYPLGFSYFIFRLIHYVVEVHRGKIKAATYAELLGYLLFFPTFLAGPLERFPQYSHDRNNTQALSAEDLLHGLWRILSGVIKKFFIADSMAHWISPLLATPLTTDRLSLWLAMFGLGWQLYLDFSGYSDMAIGVARCLGYRVRENFHWPFFKHNLALHWRAWHISMHQWIRDYFFLPLFGTSWGRWDRPRAKLYLGTFAAMMVFHLWHGLTANFFLMGLYHGLALMVWNWVQEEKRRSLRWKKLMHARGLPGIKLFWGVITYVYVSLGFVLFFYPIQHAGKIFYALFGLGIG